MHGGYYNTTTVSTAFRTTSNNNNSNNKILAILNHITILFFLLFAFIATTSSKEGGGGGGGFFVHALSSSSSPTNNMVATNAASTAAGRNYVFYWFRMGDMRLHDNPGLTRAVELCTKLSSSSSSSPSGSAGTSNSNACLVPVMCFDPRIFGDGARSEFGSLKCGPRRAKFVLDSVADLRQNLQQKGSDLLVSSDKPEIFMSKLLQDLKSSSSSTKPATTRLVFQDEVASEEIAIAHKVKKLFGAPSNSEAVWGSTLYDLMDLPYDLENNLSDMPDTFTPFRNKVEKKCSIRSPLQTPKQLDKFSPKSSLGESSLSTTVDWNHELTWMPTLKDLGYTDDQVEEASTHDDRGVMLFVGGETAALSRVKDYIWDKDLLRKYFDTRNGMIGADYSTKLSPWLAHGNVSPRYVAQQCKKYEEERVANKSTYWVVFELLWRDFFKFFAMKHGSAIFLVGGTIGSDKPWKHFDKNVQAWIECKTGFPLVDANMRELAATGFMSNRGRQNVCSFLALELNQDWRYGADHFESLLLDYDPYSNWGNWCAGAGMTGGRLNRFNIVKQSKDYDQHGDYVRHWLPELKDVPTQFVHEPWKMSQFQQTESKCRLGVDYPNPIVKPFYPNYRDGGRSKGDNNNNKGRKNNNNSSNNKRRDGGNNTSNRGRGQRRDMKSLKQGNYDIVG